MLLQSSFPSCDSHQTRQARPKLRISTPALFTSPPASPPAQPTSSFSNIFNACRSLQAFILDPAPVPAPVQVPTAMTTPEHPSSAISSLPTPPLSYAPSPPKLRLRNAGARQDLPRKRIVKRAAATPPRGANKRRRDVDDDMGRTDELLWASDEEPMSDVDSRSRNPTTTTTATITAASTFGGELIPSGPSTPKRARLAPESMPLGLERRDFHDLHLMNGGGPEELAPPAGADVDVEADGSEWTAEDDRMLVELVLEKLKLSKAEWQECARFLGKDKLSLGRRWKTLMAQSDVGLKPKKSRRARLPATWR